MTPRVSVVMSVNNGEGYLAEAMDSILNQTFHDLEFIVIDDGSTDSTPDILARYHRQDSRVSVRRFDENRGLSSALNFGIHLSRGEYIARMDADDVSLPQRLERQIAFLDANPDIDICGTWVEVVGRGQSKVWTYPATHEMIHAYMLFANMISHPSVVMRTSCLFQNQLFYNEQIQYAQDYELWSRAITVARFAVLDVIGIQYRTEASLNPQKRAAQIQTHEFVYRNLMGRLGIPFSPEELRLHCKIGLYQFDDDVPFLEQARRWLEKLSTFNRRFGNFSPRMFDSLLGQHWTAICLSHGGDGLPVCANILCSSLPFLNSSGIRKVYKLSGFLLRRFWNTNEYIAG